MRNIANFKEFTGSNTDKSLKDCVNSKPYENKGAILEYLKNGEEYAASTKIVRDYITGRSIAIYPTLKRRDGLAWPHELEYYIDKYNIKLPKEIEEEIISKIN